MYDAGLQNRRILVVEDEYLLASDLSIKLGSLGAIVLGPIGNLDDALELIKEETPIHGVVLDLNLHGAMAFAAADLLAERGIPFVFTTGYDASSIPARFGHVPRCEKPANLTQVARAVERAMAAQI